MHPLAPEEGLSWVNEGGTAPHVSQALVLALEITTGSRRRPEPRAENQEVGLTERSGGNWGSAASVRPCLSVLQMSGWLLSWHFRAVSSE